MAAENTAVLEIPKHLVMGNVTYNSDDNHELKAFINAVANASAEREKKKLYSQINELKGKVTELMTIDITPKQTIDTVKLTADITAAVTESIDAKFKAQLDAAFQPLTKQAELAKKAQLADYKLKLITANQTTCIPEIIVGNTEAELDASLQESIRIRSQFGEKQQTVQNGNTQNNNNQASNTGQNNNGTQNANTQNTANNTTTIPVINAPVTTNANPAPVSDIKNMSLDEFAKKREQLRKEIQSM